MKTKLILIAALMMLGLSVSAFAQASFTVSSIPQTVVANSGYTEKTGDIIFTTIPTSNAAVTGTITINYGVPITNNTVTMLNNVVVTGAGAPVVSVISSTGTQLVLGLNSQAAAAAFSIRVFGIRVAVADTPLTTLDATLTATGNGYTAGQTTVRVISSIAAGIASFTSNAPVTINAILGGTGTSQLRLLEGYLDAFGVTTATDPSQTVGHMLKINVSAAPPAGISFTFPAAGFVGGPLGTQYFTRCDATGVLSATTLTISSVTPTPIAVYYVVTTDTNLLAADTFTFDVTVTAAAPTTAYSDLTITANASMAPIGIATVPGAIPRFKEVPVGAASLISITRATTTMLIPYAVSQSTVNGYDTGIAIANTTKDPGATAMALLSGAVPQFGKITFYFFPLGGGTPFTYTTAAGSPGSGISTDGTIASGSSYVVLLSQLLNAASHSLDFSGYIVIVTSFTNAHGQYFISNFEAFTNGALIEIIAAGRANVPETLTH